jgi:FkbM family methyltransferase
MKSIARKIYILIVASTKALLGALRGDYFHWNYLKWYLARGDRTHRLNYDLTPNSVVFDLGSYRCQFIDEIYEKFHCSVYGFEAMPKFAKTLQNKYSSQPKIRVFPFGLSSSDKKVSLTDSEDASSANKVSGNAIAVDLKDIAQVIKDLNVESIDLIKINVEGEEFELLPRLVETGLQTKCKNIQVQFHTFIPGAEAKRAAIAQALEATHHRTWCYPFIWENWELK